MFKKNLVLFLMMVLVAMPVVAQVELGKGHDSSNPVEITADSLEVLQGQNKAIFSGDVQAKQGSLDIRSKEMVVFYKNSAAGQKDTENKVSKVEINGDVFISTPKETAKGDSGIYDVDAGVIALDGNVTLTSGKNIVKGSKLVYNLKTGQSKIVSGGKAGGGAKQERVKGVFMPGSKN